MENLAYISLIAAYEDLENNKPVTFPQVRHLVRDIQEATWKSLSVQTLLRLLSLGLFVAILGWFNSALALMRLGDRGSLVTELQQDLRSLGYFSGPVTGDYGPLTQEAVTSFQVDYRLTADGVVGPNTERVLQAQFSPTPPISQSFNPDSRPYLQPGNRGAEVKRLQERLIIAGYKINPDSIYGAETKEAVRLFQTGNRLLGDGITDLDTWQVLHRKFYVVVVPARNGATLVKVREKYKNAYEAYHRLGYYIHVGAYIASPYEGQKALNIAKARVKKLRSLGFKDARVAYL
ncbi:MAG: peptidoglycan-binding protein [Oscillatoria sp. SIO1A7]|nr:peptidoglycan-binding protein [Oscillatoria sp. SIO1A7]